MSTKEQIVISKLVAIADKQQSTLVKLAQAVSGTQPDPETVKYLKSAWQTAALNSGVTSVATPDVTFNPTGESSGGATMGENYVLKGDIPANNREIFTRNLQNQVRNQRPDLDGKYSTIFTDTVKSIGANMDSRKILEKLFKIAQNQQKIINKLAQGTDLATPMKPNMAKHQNASVAIRSKMGPLAQEIASVGVSQEALQGGAKFKVTWSANQEPKSGEQAVEDSIAAAVQALQNEMPSPVPMGNFYVERA
jgi:hypothetical protein